LETELEAAQRAVALAIAAGADQAEATCSATQRFAAEARDREITKLEQALARSLTLRVFVRGAKSTLSTTDLSRSCLETFTREAVATARFVENDEYGGLPEDAGIAAGDTSLGMFSDDVTTRAPGAKIGDALELESIARAIDPRIVNSNGSRVTDNATRLALVNSNGFAGEYRSTVATLSATPIAQDGAAKWSGAYGAAARSYATLEAVGAVAGKAAHRALGMIGARKPATMRCPVLFERDVAAGVLGDVFAAVSAANVATGNTFLGGSIGKRVGSDVVTIVDDGLLPLGLGSLPFDAEGVPTRRTVVMEGGTLRTFLYDTYYGRKLDHASTGNASGGGVGATNFFLEPGTASLADLIASTERGVLVTETIGFSVEWVTGTYSRGARGYFIENGALAYPIDEFTIAGNLGAMLAAVDAVANDLVFDQSIVAPSFRVAEMTISGGS
jgi:PmbA protein